MATTPMVAETATETIVETGGAAGTRMPLAKYLDFRLVA